MIFLAWRYLMIRRRQTLLTLLGVFFGTTAYVAVSGFFLGFQGYLVDQLVNNAAQVHIQARDDTLQTHALDRAFFNSNVDHPFWGPGPSGVIGYVSVQNPRSWYIRLNADPRVESYSPLMTAPALFTLSKLSVSATLIGCDPIRQAKITTIADSMVEGKFTDIAAGGHRLIIGSELQRHLGAAVGNIVMVSVGTRSPTPYKVVGLYSLGNRAADSQAYGSLQDVQKLKGTPNELNEIGVRLKDYTQSASIASTWSKLTPERTESWDQQNANILSMFRLQDTLRYSMIATVLIVAGFGIYNILNMTVTQKRQDIAILRSMGYDGFDVIMLFFLQGLTVGFIGAIFGLVAGYLLCVYLQTIPFMPANATNPAGHLYISLSPLIYLEGTLLALLSSSIASILPARKAGQLTPIEIIRAGG
jgi:lipoprotein-releasing system permease protein